MHEVDRFELQIEVPQEHLFELRNWLIAEDELRGRVAIPRTSPAEGQMGAVIEVLTVALGSGGVGAVLAQSLSTWLTQRRADVSLTVKRADGEQVQLDVKRASEPESLIRLVGALLDRPKGGQ